MNDSSSFSRVAPRVVGLGASSSSSSVAPYRYGAGFSGATITPPSSPSASNSQSLVQIMNMPRTPTGMQGFPSQSSQLGSPFSVENRSSTSPSWALNAFSAAMEAANVSVASDVSGALTLDFNADDDDRGRSNSNHSHNHHPHHHHHHHRHQQYHGGGEDAIENRRRSPSHASSGGGGGKKSSKHFLYKDETIAERILRQEREAQHTLIDRAKSVSAKIMSDSTTDVLVLLVGGVDDFLLEERLSANLEKINTNLSKRASAMRSTTESLVAYRTAQKNHDPAIFFGDNIVILSDDGIADDNIPRTGSGNTLKMTATASERAVLLRHAHDDAASHIKFHLLLPALDAALDESDERTRQRLERERIAALDSMNERESALRDEKRRQSAAERAAMYSQINSSYLDGSDDPMLNEIRRAAAARRQEEAGAAAAAMEQEEAAMMRRLHESRMRLDHEYRARHLAEERTKKLAPKDLATIRAELEAAEREQQEIEARLAQKKAREEEKKQRARDEFKRQVAEEAEAEAKAARLEARLNANFSTLLSRSGMSMFNTSLGTSMFDNST